MSEQSYRRMLYCHKIYLMIRSSHQNLNLGVKGTRETIVAQTRTSIEAQMDSLTNTITSTIGILIGYFSSEVASTKA